MWQFIALGAFAAGRAYKNRKKDIEAAEKFINNNSAGIGVSSRKAWEYYISEDRILHVASEEIVALAIKDFKKKEGSGILPDRIEDMLKSSVANELKRIDKKYCQEIRLPLKKQLRAWINNQFRTDSKSYNQELVNISKWRKPKSEMFLANSYLDELCISEKIPKELKNQFKIDKPFQREAEELVNDVWNKQREVIFEVIRDYVTGAYKDAPSAFNQIATSDQCSGASFQTCIDLISLSENFLSPKKQPGINQKLTQLDIKGRIAWDKSIHQDIKNLITTTLREQDAYMVKEFTNSLKKADEISLGKILITTEVHGDAQQRKLFLGFINTYFKTKGYRRNVSEEAQHRFKWDMPLTNLLIDKLICISHDSRDELNKQTIDAISATLDRSDVTNLAALKINNPNTNTDNQLYDFLSAHINTEKFKKGASIEIQERFSWDPQISKTIVEYLNEISQSAKKIIDKSMADEIVESFTYQDYLTLGKIYIQNQNSGAEAIDLSLLEFTKNYKFSSHCKSTVSEVTQGRWEWDDSMYKLILQEIRPKAKAMKDRSLAEIADANSLSGVEYEELCERILTSCGWKVEFTAAKGDQGVDLVCKKNSIRICIQCKRSASSVNNKAVQEVLGGRHFYEPCYVAVVTNSDYTTSAKELAKASDTLLLQTKDLYKLDKLIP